MKNPKKPSKNYSFEQKWSSAIAAHGHTAIPNILLRNYESLGITSPELRMIIAIEIHRWDDSNPWPSVATLARLVGTTPRRARELISSLHNKCLIIRRFREHDSSAYSLDPLIHKLDQLATSSLPPGRKDPPSWEETRLESRTETSSKEDAANQDTILKPNINTGLEKVEDTLRRRYMK